MKKIFTFALYITLAVIGGIFILAVACGDGNKGLLDLL
jgi:hypothetical protein